MSFIFLGKIATRSQDEYVGAFRNSTEAELLADCLAQVHRNAEIARDKFFWVRISMLWSFIAIVPWEIALGVLVGLRNSP